jgi:hypothetical protein
MVDAENENCPWYSFPKTDSTLDKFIKERTLTNEQTEFCTKRDEDEVQYISVSYIRCVKLADIAIPSPWSPSRSEQIRKWATPDSLRTVKFFTDKDTNQEVINSSSLPRISREIDFRKEKQDKFTIGDGIHRINAAKALGLDCVLCRVTEDVILTPEQVTEYVSIKTPARTKMQSPKSPGTIGHWEVVGNKWVHFPD